MKKNDNYWRRLNGFAIEAKLLGISPLVEEPHYLPFREAFRRAYTLHTSGVFMDFMSIFYPRWTVKYNESLDYHHKVDALAISPSGEWVSIDVSTYPKPPRELRADVNIVDGRSWSFWRHQIETCLQKKRKEGYRF
jgi:hypothetical protein